MKNYTIAIVVILLVGIGIYYYANKNSVPREVGLPIAQNENVATTTQTKPTATPVEGDTVVIGKSVNGKEIVAHNYGKGDKRVLFVGGIHGGYSWNTTLVAYELMAYLKSNPEAIPSGIKVTVIPILNPDGLAKVVPNINKFSSADVNPSQSVQVEGRFNSNKVDLSRNFDCNWQPTAKWKTNTVSGGTEAFSEPEAVAIKNYVSSHNLSAVVVWYSSAGGIYASSCENNVSPTTTNIMNAYASGSGYPAYDSYDFYETSGDLPNWLAKVNIPAISVLLTTHTGTEWDKNRKGVEMLLKYISNKS